MSQARKLQWIYAILFLLLVPNCYGQRKERNLNSLEWKFRRVGDSAWYKATVPGTIYTDLLSNKLIPDPFYGDNEKLIQWVDTCDWEYEAEFNISVSELSGKSEIDLVFNGLDTYAKVYVNDSLVLAADDMFQTWAKDVKPLLKAGKNTIIVNFFSTAKEGKKRASERPYTMPGEDRVYTRKAAYQFGWDFAPRFLGCGIWKDVELDFSDYYDVSISANYSIDTLADAIAKVRLHYTIYSSDTASNLCYLFVKCDSLPEQQKQVLLHYGLNEGEVEIVIQHPTKWWCNGLGKPYMYKVYTNLFNQNHVILARSDLNMGLRTIYLVRDSDKIGSSFYFKLNGVPVFMKGANYIPPDVFLPKATKGKYDSLIDMAAAANMNMLRVWGGGVYPDDEFYNECDRKGILVWQDFMFACGMYPTKEYGYDWSDEMEENISCGQHHPCLALWCGNNEDEEGWYNWDWQKQYKYTARDSSYIWTENQMFFRWQIPELMRHLYEYEPVNYIPTSPQIGWGHEEAMRYGDSHYWGVWWGMEPFEIYNKKVPRFMSEYGFQSLPDISTLSKITDTLSLSSLKLKNHQKHPTGFQTIDEYMKRDFKVPEKFEDYVYVSQLLQAEGMQTAIEAHRRAKPYCMGTLYWQFNDCWPGITWSSIDYYGKPKASYYRVKELYENIIISVVKENGKYNVYIVSDSNKDLKYELSLHLMDFNGKILNNKSMKVKVAANSSRIYASVDSSFLGKVDTTNTVLVCILTKGHLFCTEKIFCFAKPKNQNLQTTDVKVRVGFGDIHVSSDKMVKNVYLKQEGVIFSDNYFDLFPGETKRISYVIPDPNWKYVPLNITTLNDVMNRNH